MAHIIDSCQPDCPDRTIGCHAKCDRYKEARVKYEAHKKTTGLTVADTYYIDRGRNLRDSHVKYVQKKGPYKGSANNFAK